MGRLQWEIRYRV